MVEIICHKCGTSTNIKPDGLHWFSTTSYPTPYFWGCTPRGLWPPNPNSAEIYVLCTYPQISSSCVYSFGSYRVDKQTDRHCWKHSTFFATLRRWVTRDNQRRQETRQEHVKNRTISAAVEDWNLMSDGSPPQRRDMTDCFISRWVAPSNNTHTHQLSLQLGWIQFPTSHRH